METLQAFFAWWHQYGTRRDFGAFGAPDAHSVDWAHGDSRTSSTAWRTPEATSEQLEDSRDATTPSIGDRVRDRGVAVRRFVQLLAEFFVHDPSDDVEAQSLALHLIQGFADRSLLEFLCVSDDQIAELLPEQVTIVACHHRFCEKRCCLLGKRVDLVALLALYSHTGRPLREPRNRAN